MNLIPEEHFTPRLTFNFAPMVDFLFIILAIFALVALTRKALFDADINFVHHETSTSGATPLISSHIINLSISALGKYKWIDAKGSHTFNSIQSVKESIFKQLELENLSADPAQVQILLHIDQNAQWHPIAKLIFALQEEGFTVYPIYEKKPFILKN